MNKKIIFFIIILSLKSFANCSADPFSSECEATNASALQHEILCANGFKINSNGDVKDGAGNVIANVGSVSTASKSLNACKNYGGTAAYAKKDNGLTTSGNQNAVVSNSNSSGVSVSSASSAHIAINEDPNAVVTGTGGSLGGGGGAGGGDGSVSGGGSGSSSCTSACECPNSMDACSSGSCVTITTSHPLCSSSSGILVKGDTTCQWLCSNGSLTCPAGGQVCGSGGDKVTTTGGDFAGGGGSGNGCGPGIGTYNGMSTCCPATHPYTSTQQHCCKNAASENVCI